MIPIKTYITHYTPLVERKQFMENQISRFGLNAEFILNYDRENLTTDEIQIFDRYHPKLNRELKLSEISLTLKHFKCYKRIIQNNEPYALILEDDALLCDDFNEKITDYFNQLPDDFDMVFLGNGCNMHIDSSLIVPNKNVYLTGHTSRCTDSYIISQNFAKKIIDKIYNTHTSSYKIFWPIDFLLSDLMSEFNVNNYWAEPTIVTQSNMFQTSNCVN